ncbi:hypothetical protein EMIT0P12_80038 [Pseudomonas sp. IT-P12]
MLKCDRLVPLAIQTVSFLRPPVGRQFFDDKIIRGLLHVCFPRIRLSRTGFAVPRHAGRVGRATSSGPRNLQRSIRCARL